MRISDWSSDVCSSDLEKQTVRREDHVGDRVGLPLVAVQDRAHREGRRIDVGRDDRPQGADAVEALGARPLGEGRVDRKSAVQGTRVVVRVDHGGSRNLQKKKNQYESM